MSFLRDGGDIDVGRVVKKIKSQYTRFAETYGSRVFNLKAFEERYENALRGKMNLKVFLHAEILAVEDLIKRVEKEKSREPRRPGFGEIADGIVEKNLQKVRKYRSVDFHPDAEIETKHLLGATTDFYEKLWARAARALKPLRLKGMETVLARLEGDFAYYVLPFGGSYSRAVDDYTLVLSRRSPRDSEKAAVNFIRFGGILLNNCARALTDGINALERSPPGSARSDASSSGEAAAGSLCLPAFPDTGPLRELVRCREILLRLIEDFRLGDIRGY
jgi:hypothetical protein